MSAPSYLDSFSSMNLHTKVRASMACALSASSGQSPGISPASTPSRYSSSGMVTSFFCFTSYTFSSGLGMLSLSVENLIACPSVSCRASAVGVCAGRGACSRAKHPPISMHAARATAAMNLFI